MGRGKGVTGEESGSLEKTGEKAVRPSPFPSFSL